MDVSRIFGKIFKTGTPAKSDEKKPAPPPVSQAALEAETDVPEGAAGLGVKYTCRYAWQILPPAGWQRQENGISSGWPFTGTSPFVSFTNTSLPGGESAMLRWQLAGNPESRESHEQLERLLGFPSDLTPASVREISGPGIVTSMKVTDVDRLAFPGGLMAIILSARYLPLKGEEPLLRYVIILPDRVMENQGQTSFFRETVQFVATESSFWTNEKLAIASIKTFRRNDASQTAYEKGFVSGTYPTISAKDIR